MHGTIAVETAPRSSRRAARLEMEGALAVAGRIQELQLSGCSILNLSIGEPTGPTPDHIKDAGIRSLEAGETRYAPPAGLPQLREAVAGYLAQRGIASSPGRVVITPGAKPALFYSVLALIKPGDEVLLPDPGFPIYRSIVRFAGGTPVSYGLHQESGFQPDPAELATLVSPRTRLIILNSPHNPTGGCISLAALEQIAELVLRHRLVVLSDEVYHRFWYGEGRAAPSIAALPGLASRMIVVDGFSKTWAMTGWRLGFAAVPTSLAATIERFAVNVHSCVPPFVQRAGLAALTGPDQPVQEMVDGLRRRRDILVGGLNRIEGIQCPVPEGAFYAFPDISPILRRSRLAETTFASRLLEDYHVATLPGSGFGREGRGRLRLSFTAPEQDLRAALQSLGECVETTLSQRETQP
jgi:aspartate aminotransferase